MNIEQRTFQRVIKARRRHESRMRAIRQGSLRNRFATQTHSYEKLKSREGFFSKIVRRISDKMQRRIVPR